MATGTNYSVSIASGVTEVYCGLDAPPVVVPPTEIDIGTDWLFYGDSQTDGRALEAALVGHSEVFQNIWNQTNTTSITRYKDGLSGCSLLDSNDRYSAYNSRNTASWVHFQESGGQDVEEDTSEKYSQLLDDFANDINTDSPNAVQSTETAYSFEAEAETNPNRDWTQYNIDARAKIAELDGLGITVYLAETDRNITELVAQKRTELGTTAGQEAVWGGAGNTLGRHFTGLGNFMVALGIFEALGYDVTTLDLSNITTADLSTADRSLCLNILASF